MNTHGLLPPGCLPRDVSGSKAPVDDEKAFKEWFQNGK